MPVSGGSSSDAADDVDDPWRPTGSEQTAPESDGPSLPPPTVEAPSTSETSSSPWASDDASIEMSPPPAPVDQTVEASEEPASPWAPSGSVAGSSLLSSSVSDVRPSRSIARPVPRTADGVDDANPWHFPAAPGHVATDDDGSRGASPSRSPSSTPDDVVVAATADAEPGVDPVSTAEPTRAGPRRWLPIVAAVVLAVVGVVAVRSVLRGGESSVDGPRLPAAVDERWTASIGDRFVLDAVVTSQAVVVVTGREEPGGVEVTAFDAIDGRERWARPLDSVATDLTVVDDDLVVVSATREFAEGRYSFAVDPATGDEVWNRTGDGVVLSTPAMGLVGIVDSGRFPATEPSLELVDLTTGITIPPIGGRLAGLGADGDVIAIDDEGSVRTIDVSAFDPSNPTAELAGEVVATTSPDRRNVVELGGRYFAADDGGLVEIGFAADAGRVLLDRRPEDQTSDPIPQIAPSSFFAPVDGRHAAMLGADGAMGIELAGDELRVVWSADAAFELPRRVDGDRVAIEVVREAGPPSDAFRMAPTELIDAPSGDVLVEFDGWPTSRLAGPVDGVLGWEDLSGGGRPTPEFDGTVVGIGLDGTRRFELPDVTAGPFIGDRTVLVARRDGESTSLAFFDEGPRSRPS